MIYLERGDSRFSEKGRFEWDETGGKIQLLTGDTPGQEGNWFRVGENRLIMLDIEGNPIENNIPAEMYVYQKIDLDHIITEKYWKLIELNGKEVAPAEEGRREAHIILKNEDNRVVEARDAIILWALTSFRNHSTRTAFVSPPWQRPVWPVSE